MLHPLNWSLALPAYAAAFAFGYLCGSIPFGVLLTRLAGVADVRAIGSGNIGATNVLRTGRKGLAAATLLGDMLKGTVAVLLTAYVLDHDFAIAAAVGAFLGHLFPVWLALSRRQGGGDLYRRSARSGLARGHRILRDLARGRRADPLLVAGGADRQRRHAGVPVVVRRRAGRSIISAVVGAAMDHAPRQHHATFPRQGRKNRSRFKGRRRHLNAGCPAGRCLAMPQSFSPSRSRLLALCSRPDC